MVRVVTCACPVQGGANSGRKVIQEQNRQIRDALDHYTYEFERRRVNPVHVLVEGQHRLLRGQAREMFDQRLQCPPLLNIRGQRQSWIAPAGRHPEQGGEQRYHLNEVLGHLAEHCLELV
jgi:hypothetical protein